MKITLLTIVTICISACSGVNFNTNLGPYTASRINTALVREYSIEEINKYDATSLGFVEASHCQEKPDASKANRTVLVNDLKQRTRTLGGNGVVVEACGTAVFVDCRTYMECRGVAYAVPERK